MQYYNAEVKKRLHNIFDFCASLLYMTDLTFCQVYFIRPSRTSLGCLFYRLPTTREGNDRKSVNIVISQSRLLTNKNKQLNL
jgi:hypothetical protein